MSDRAPLGGPLVAEVAGILLDGVVAHYAATEDAPPLPARRYIAAGGPREVAYDCEQVTVAASGIGWGQSPSKSPQDVRSGGPMAALAVRHVVYALAVVRSVADPSGAGAADLWDPEDDPTFPSAETEHALGLRHMRDMALVSQALINVASEVRNLRPIRQVAREMGNRNPAQADGLVLPGVVESLGPAGGYVSVEAAFTVTVGEVG